MKRRTIREKVLQALYAYELSQNPPDAVARELFHDMEGHPTTYGFALGFFRKCIEMRDELDSHIRKRLAHWEYDRLAYIDKIILRMGTAEMLYFEDIPPKVTIDEMIELARRFSTDQSDKFVNGVLDGVLEDLNSAGLLMKRGRGLITTVKKKSGEQ